VLQKKSVVIGRAKSVTKKRKQNNKNSAGYAMHTIKQIESRK
jgi:hypothetical protein